MVKLTKDLKPISGKKVYVRDLTYNQLKNNYIFNIQRLSELEAYVNVLPDDAVAPKMELQEVIEYMKQEQMKLAQMKAEAQTMQMRANMFLNQDPNAQMQTVEAAEQQMAEQVPVE